jgi:molybdate transport system substrate-binding protein
LWTAAGFVKGGAYIICCTGRTLTGICVRDGAPLPDISTPKSFRQTLLDAGSIAYTDPKAGGTSGIFLTGLLARLGIAGAVASKAILCRNGDEVVEKVADGAAAIGSTFISEMLPVKGVRVVGPLPPGIQNATAYAAGISASSRHREAAGRFIAMLVAPAQRELWIACGFEPAEHA